ncbi:hypothetical protein QZH56_25730 [Streptomyces olivoreticuli]|uniref:hypothetical protein n=1 Tax=Streptomyces olivoreticuli TaxID=68246 RepID=UPI00265B0AAC|nr:hypothetical protein [Streptomyces olivoreticuli]WKK22178.1 hypothetical protein QZH56_25730 [Streptomyces olivoreticuli]
MAAEENAGARLTIESRGVQYAVDGSQYNYPSVVVRNIGPEWIGPVRITVENVWKERIAFMDPQLTMSRWEHEGTPQEEILGGVVSPGENVAQRLTCESVDLNLDNKPGQWVVLYPRVDAHTSRRATTGVLYFTIDSANGSERLGYGKVEVNVR